MHVVDKILRHAPLIPGNKRRSFGAHISVTTTAFTSCVTERQQFLIATNTALLEQAINLLERLSPAIYRVSPHGLEPQRASAHFRHIIEFYECLLDGRAMSHVDYGSRRRDPDLERDPRGASARIRGIVERLTDATDLRFDSVLWVRMENADAFGGPATFLMSSVGREIQTLASHTVHHFALIAMILRLHGLELDPGFGVAPSTLSFWSTRTACAR